MFPKERYQYSEKPNDSQQVNNHGAHLARDDMHKEEKAIEHNDHQLMDTVDDCDSMLSKSASSSISEDMDEAIFLSTFTEQPPESSDDEYPAYDDGD